MSDLPARFVPAPVPMRADHDMADPVRAAVPTGPAAEMLARVADAPVLIDLPVDRQRPFRRAPQPIRQRIPVDQRDSTVWTALLLVLLYRYSGETDLVLAEDADDATVRLHRFAVRPDGSLAELVRQVADVLNTDTAPIALAELVAARHPDTASGRLPLTPAAIAAGDRPDLLASHDITVVIDPAGATLVADGEVWEEQTVRRMAEHLAALCTAADDATVASVRLLSDRERATILLDWNDSGVEWPNRATYPELVAEHALTRPDDVALVDGAHSVSFGELDADTNRIAQALRRRGAVPGTRVALLCARSAAFVRAVVGILKTGAAVVLLDPVNPDARIEHMVSDSAPLAIVTSADLRARAPEGPECLVIDSAAFLDEQPLPVPVEITGDTVSHLVYTSGTTGQPKAVLERHAALVNLVHWTERAYGVRPGDRASWTSAPGFAVQLMEWMPYLALGVPVHVADAETASSPRRLRDWLVASGITHTMLVAALAERAWKLDWPAETRLRIMVTTAERVHEWPPVDRPFTVVMTYGTSETTNTLTCLDIGAGIDFTSAATPPAVRAARQVPVGRPIANQRVYVLDEAGDPVPVGVIGRLFVAGAGLSAGYHRRPELTEAVFRPNHLAEEPSDQLYDTGDFARLRADGVVEIIGRADTQVKIRGFRVELGEVEQALTAHPDVDEAAVIVRQLPGRGTRLIAYLAAEAGAAPTARQMREWLAGRLPHYMVPTAFVVLPALPRLANGKIAASALPEPATNGREGVETPFVAARTDTERRLTEIWSRVLHVDGVGMHDDFVELGGHSLLAFQLVEEIRSAMDVEVGLTDLNRRPTVAGMAELIESGEVATRSGAGALPALITDPAARFEPFPLNDSQQALWIGRGGDIELGNVGCHGYFEWESTDLDLDRFTAAWRRLVDRHDSLRTVIGHDGQQRVLAEPPDYSIPVVDLRAIDQDDAGRRLLDIRSEMSHQVIPDDCWPMFDLRVSLLRGRTRIHLSLDMLIADAWSYFQVLVPDLVQLYEQPQVELEPLALTFRDYVLTSEAGMEATELYQRSRRYWLDRLADLPPAPQLPARRGTWPDGPIRFDRYDHQLTPAEWNQLQQRGKAVGVTASAVLTTVFAEVLRAWSGQDRMTINFPLFNRIPVHPDVNRLVGDTTTTLLVAVEKVDGTFADRARDVQQRLWQDLEHRHFSGVRVLRELARQRGDVSPAMPIVLTSLLGHPPRRFATTLGEAIYSISQTPQVSIDFQVFEIEGELRFNWDYLPALFPDGLIGDMFAAYCDVLHQLAAGPEAWQQKDFDLLPAAQRQVRAAVNDTAVPVRDVLLHELLAEQAAQRPDAMAVISTRRNLDFAELNAEANRIGRRVRELGARPGQLVGVVMHKGWEQFAAVYGVLVAGAAYLPVDAALPPARLRHLLADGEVHIVLTQPDLVDTLDWPDGVRVLAVGEDFADVDDAPLPSVQRQTDLAYVIHTSGSTGEPKGVMVDHRGVVNHVDDVVRRFGIGQTDRALATAALSFDMSVFDVFGIIGSGGCVVLPNPSQHPDPDHWIDLIHTHGVTFWAAVPGVLELGVGRAELVRPDSLATLRVMVLAGDWIPLDLPGRLRALSPRVMINSCGGPTETVNWSITYPIGDVDPEWVSIPYGRPMSNHRCHVLGERFEDRPDWVAGQIYDVSEVGLAHGYWGDPDRTAQRFVTLPHSGERAYATGDLGRYLPSGDIEILGRTDFQVKLRGHRIELGEIESALGTHAAVRTAVVVAVGDGAERALVAHVVLTPGETASPDELRAHVAGLLPVQMVPASVVIRDSIPLSTNGKVDRKKLTELPGPISVADTDGQRPVAGPLETTIARVWRDVLNVDSVTATTGFLNLGGNSMSAATLARRLGELLGVDIPLRMVFDRPTVADMAAALLADPERGAAVAEIAELIEQLDLAGADEEWATSVETHGEAR